MALPEGYRMLKPAELTALGFSARSQRIQTPTGDVLPRRQVMNRLMAEVGYAGKEGGERGAWRSWQQERLSPQYQRDIGEAMQKAGLRGGSHSPEYWQLRGARSDFNELVRETRKASERENREPGGPKARLLEYMGRREPKAPYDVGATPPGKRKAPKRRRRRRAKPKTPPKLPTQQTPKGGAKKTTKRKKPGGKK
jgi:hypothetical protein